MYNIYSLLLFFWFSCFWGACTYVYIYIYVCIRYIQTRARSISRFRTACSWYHHIYSSRRAPRCLSRNRLDRPFLPRGVWIYSACAGCRYVCTWHDREDTQTCRGSGRGSGSWCASRPCRTACTCEGCSRLAPGQRSAACARLLNLQHQHKTSHFQLLASQHDLHDDEPPAAHSVSTAARSLLSFSLSFSFLSCILSLSRSLSLSFSLFALPPPPPYLLLLILRLSSASLLFSPLQLASSSLFFFFFITSPLIFPSFTLLLTNQGRDRATRIYIYTRFLFPCLSHRREVFLAF